MTEYKIDIDMNEVADKVGQKLDKLSESKEINGLIAEEAVKMICQLLAAQHAQSFIQRAKGGLLVATKGIPPGMAGLPGTPGLMK